MIVECIEATNFSYERFHVQSQELFDLPVIMGTSQTYNEIIYEFIGVDVMPFKDEGQSYIFNFINEELDIFNSDIAEVYYFDKLVKGNSIVDTFNNFPFYDIDVEGWFIFVDPCIKLNWSHECNYYFIEKEGKFTRERQMNWLPKMVDQMNLYNFRW